MRKGPTDIKRWEEDALADGWDIQKTRTCDVLTRDGFVVHVYDKEIAI